MVRKVVIGVLFGFLGVVILTQTTIPTIVAVPFLLVAIGSAVYVLVRTTLQLVILMSLGGVILLIALEPEFLDDLIQQLQQLL
jgi:hypothetical protein